MFVERFFDEAGRRLENVVAEHRAKLRERLALARAMLGALDPLDFLKEWRAPVERYTSKYIQDELQISTDHEPER